MTRRGKKKVFKRISVGLVTVAIFLGGYTLVKNLVAKPSKVILEPAKTQDDIDELEDLNLTIQDRDLYKFNENDFSELSDILRKELIRYGIISLNEDKIYVNDYVYEAYITYFQGTSLEELLTKDGIISEDREDRISNADAVSKVIAQSLSDNVYLDGNIIKIKNFDILDLSTIFDDYEIDTNVLKEINASYKRFLEALTSGDNSLILEATDNLHRQITALDDDDSELTNITEASLGIQKVISKVYGQAYSNNLKILFDKFIVDGLTSVDELSNYFELNSIKDKTYVVRTDIPFDVELIKDGFVRDTFEKYRENRNYNVKHSNTEVQSLTQIDDSYSKDSEGVITITNSVSQSNNAMVKRELSIEDFSKFNSQISSEYKGRLNSIIPSVTYMILIDYIHGTPLEKELMDSGIICNNQLLAYYDEKGKVVQYDPTGSWVDVTNFFDRFGQEVINNSALDVGLNGKKVTIDNDSVVNFAAAFDDISVEDKTFLELAYTYYVNIRKGIEENDFTMISSNVSSLFEHVFNEQASRGARALAKIAYVGPAIDHMDVLIKALRNKGYTTNKELAEYFDTEHMNDNTFVPLSYNPVVNNISNKEVAFYVEYESKYYLLMHTMSDEIISQECLNYQIFPNEEALDNYLHGNSKTLAQ
ncbi:MAG: hypothetical protein PHD02_04830 [Bacilli bacterium]|nr:hypothetical protein [Bacilli bacterium]